MTLLEATVVVVVVVYVVVLVYQSGIRNTDRLLAHRRATSF